MQATDSHVDPGLCMSQPIPAGYFLTVHLTHAGITATGCSTLTLAQIKCFSTALFAFVVFFFFTAFKSLAQNVLLFDLVKYSSIENSPKKACKIKSNSKINNTAQKLLARLILGISDINFDYVMKPHHIQPAIKITFYTHRNYPAL